MRDQQRAGRSWSEGSSGSKGSSGSERNGGAEVGAGGSDPGEKGVTVVRDSAVQGPIPADADS